MSYLIHYNHNHDALGRFARSNTSSNVLKKTYNKNFDKWGKSSKANVLYIAGESGSGKSTLAKKLGNNKTKIIHLDSYFDNPKGPKDKEFDSYLKKNLPEYKKLSANKNEISMNQWGKIAAKFEVQIEKYGEYQYKKGNKVICEGVQLVDDTVRPDKSYFSDKPIIVLRPGKFKSITRAAKRDNVKMTPKEVRRYLENSYSWNKDIDSLIDDAKIENGKLFLEKYYK